MADRLSALDASFLYLEDRSTPLHVGGVAVFRRPRSGFDRGQPASLIEARLPSVPRYRQKVVPVPGQLARPPWEAYLIELPVGEPNPVVRLHHLSHTMREHTDSARSVPVMPLVRDQALAIGVTSYDVGVYFGLTGDRDAMSESDTVDTLAGMLEESVDELLTSPRRP